MTRAARLTAFFAVLTAFAAGLPSAAYPQAKDKAKNNKTFSYREALKSTVWIVVPDKPIDGQRVSTRTGTGSLVDAQRGLILTNYHVVGDKEEARVFFPIIENGKIVPERRRYQDLLNTSGAYIRGRVVAREEKCDLALIQLEHVPRGAVALKLAANSPEPAQRVHSIGNPGASEALWVYTPGNVRQVYRKEFRAGKPGDYVRLNCMIVETESPVNPGDSGGPVLNDKGELVAVVQGHISDAQARSISYFIDISEVRQLITGKSAQAARQVTGGTAEAKVEAAEKPEKPTTVNASEDEKTQQFANFRLRQAKAYELDGDHAEARKYAQEVLDKYPNSKAAEDAKKLLERLKNKKK